MAFRSFFRAVKKWWSPPEFRVRVCQEQTKVTAGKKERICTVYISVLDEYANYDDIQMPQPNFKLHGHGYAVETRLLRGTRNSRDYGVFILMRSAGKYELAQNLSNDKHSQLHGDVSWQGKITVIPSCPVEVKCQHQPSLVTDLCRGQERSVTVKMLDEFGNLCHLDPQKWKLRTRRKTRQLEVHIDLRQSYYAPTDKLTFQYSFTVNGKFQLIIESTDNRSTFECFEVNVVDPWLDPRNCIVNPCESESLERHDSFYIIDVKRPLQLEVELKDCLSKPYYYEKFEPGDWSVQVDGNKHNIQPEQGAQGNQAILKVLDISEVGKKYLQVLYKGQCIASRIGILVPWLDPSKCIVSPCEPESLERHDNLYIIDVKRPLQLEVELKDCLSKPYNFDNLEPDDWTVQVDGDESTIPPEQGTHENQAVLNVLDISEVGKKYLQVLYKGQRIASRIGILVPWLDPSKCIVNLCESEILERHDNLYIIDVKQPLQLEVELKDCLSKPYNVEKFEPDDWTVRVDGNKHDIQPEQGAQGNQAVLKVLEISEVGKKYLQVLYKGQRIASRIGILVPWLDTSKCVVNPCESERLEGHENLYIIDVKQPLQLEVELKDCLSKPYNYEKFEPDDWSVQVDGNKHNIQAEQGAQGNQAILEVLGISEGDAKYVEVLYKGHRIATTIDIANPWLDPGKCIMKLCEETGTQGDLYAADNRRPLKLNVELKDCMDKPYIYGKFEASDWSVRVDDNTRIQPKQGTQGNEVVINVLDISEGGKKYVQLLYKGHLIATPLEIDIVGVKPFQESQYLRINNQEKSISYFGGVPQRFIIGPDFSNLDNINRIADPYEIKRYNIQSDGSIHKVKMADFPGVMARKTMKLLSKLFESHHFREQASHFDKEREKWKDKSQRAYYGEEYEEAKKCSVNKEIYGDFMSKSNRRASEAIFEFFNQERSESEIDLHGQLVADEKKLQKHKEELRERGKKTKQEIDEIIRKERKEMDEAIRHLTARWDSFNQDEAEKEGRPWLEIIVGAGKHSKDQRQKIMPKVKAFLKEEKKVRYEISNKGAILVVFREYNGKEPCFANFYCEKCSKVWSSASSWKGKWQRCFSCDKREVVSECFPVKLRERTPSRRKRRAESSVSAFSHEDHFRLCQKCQELNKNRRDGEKMRCDRFY